MIDRFITDFQESVIYISNSFVHRNTGPYSGSAGAMALGRLENRIVMAFSIGFTSLVDYTKLPLAAIEEIIKGILLTPTIPFSSTLSKRCFKHYGHALHYITLIFSKLILGTIHDIYTLKISLQAPHMIPHFIPPSYYGSKAIYNKSLQRQQQKDYPSLYLC